MNTMVKVALLSVFHCICNIRKVSPKDLIESLLDPESDYV